MERKSSAAFLCTDFYNPNFCQYAAFRKYFVTEIHRLQSQMLLSVILPQS